MSYFVSLHEDMRDAIEIVSASGHEHAADIAVQMGLNLPECRWPNFGELYVIHNGDLRVVEIETDVPTYEEEAA